MKLRFANNNPWAIRAGVHENERLLSVGKRFAIGIGIGIDFGAGFEIDIVCDADSDTRQQ